MATTMRSAHGERSRGMTPKFAYVAFDRAGKSVPGVIEANSEAEAREMLRHQGLFVTSIKESSTAPPQQRPAAGAKPWQAASAATGR